MPLIDLGGYRLDLRATGRGGPAVVCLSALGGGHGSWERFAALLADTTTVVTYGRPTLDGSDPLPERFRTGPGGATRMAAELWDLLAAAQIDPPYVLATCSIGGYIADRFAALFPAATAGVVWIDPSPPRNMPGAPNHADVMDDSEDGTGYVLSRQVVIAEQAARPPVNRAGRFVVLSGAVGRWLRNEPRPWHEPLTLQEVDDHWVVMQAEWAARLQAAHLIADDAGHFVQYEAPELAAFVVREVVAAARDGRPVQFDRKALAQVGGQVVETEDAV